MKDIREMLQQKEQDIQKLQREIEILRAAAAILDENETSSNSSNRSAVTSRIPANVEPITHADAVADRPKRAFP
jgi:hypothetical protein